MSIRRFSDNPSLAICKFTICFYSIFPILYTLILLTNSENIVIILLSLIFIPQIVTNAYKNHRPQLSNPYYRSFLLLRFLLIVNINKNLVLFEGISLQYLWIEARFTSCYYYKYSPYFANRMDKNPISLWAQEILYYVSISWNL